MAAKNKIRVRHLTVLLIKENIKTPEDCLKEQTSLKQLAISPNISYVAKFYYQAKQARSPAWLDFMEEGLATPIAPPINDNIAAILFVEEGKRLFAFTFSHGRSLLRPDCFERDFGLRVVLNSVDPSQLRSIDARTIEELTVHTRRQASRGSPLETFSININQDIVRLLTGKPKDPNFANRIIGSDSLNFSAKVNAGQLGVKCKELLGAYESKEYQKYFPWFDHLRAVRDPSQINKLNTKLVEKLKSELLDSVHLAPPEVIDWEQTEGLSFSTQTTPKPQHDVLVEDYLKTIKDKSKLSLERLKKDQIQVHYANSGTPIPKWSIYDSVVFEAEEGSGLFVLSGGDWFHVAKNFADEIKSKVKSIRKSDLVLPPAKRTDEEGDFNKAAAATSKFVLMDRKNAYVSGASSPIEICDLFTPARQFVHVKRKTKSATLSHLFAQGVVAAESFLMDAKLRNHARNVIAGSNPALVPLIPVDRPEPKDFEIVYGIIAKQNARWPLSLPFFSQLNLSHAHDRLLRMGYKVSLLRIDEI